MGRPLTGDGADGAPGAGQNGGNGGWLYGNGGIGTGTPSTSVMGGQGRDGGRAAQLFGTGGDGGNGRATSVGGTLYAGGGNGGTGGNGVPAEPAASAVAVWVAMERCCSLTAAPVGQAAPGTGSYGGPLFGQNGASGHRPDTACSATDGTDARCVP
jgi:hypothetical protein